MAPEPEKEYRILIVDDHKEVARVLRTSLELLERGYKIVDVPSAEEAILEVPRDGFDLVVADYKLPGMDGLELIERLKKKNEDLKSIVISAHDLEESSEQIEKLGVLEVFNKPIETEDFTNAVENALHGTKEAARAATISDKIGPVPEIDTGPISLVLGAIRTDLGANAVMLVDRKGRIVQQHGTINEDLHFSELVVLLAANFTTTGEISTYLGDAPPAALQFYDGGNYDVYSLALGLHFFVAIIFPAGSERQMGAVVRFGTRATKELVPMVSGDQPPPKEKAKDEKVEPTKKEPPRKAKKSKAKAGEKKAKKKKAEADKVKVEEEEEPEEEVEITAPESIDLDALESALAEASSDDADSFWDTATDVEIPIKDTGKAITLDEAIELGLIPKDVES